MLRIINQAMKEIYFKSKRILIYKAIKCFLPSTLFILLGCDSAKMTYNFDQGKHLNFNSGKWIVNEPKTSNNRTKIVKELAIKEFGKVITKDSLFDIVALRKTKLIDKVLPNEPSKEELKQLKLMTGCDYLINIENEIIGENEGSFRFSSTVGVAKIINKASTNIKIYNLNTLKLISNTFSMAKDKVIERENSGFNYLTSSISLAKKSLINLIRKYKKYSIKKN